GLDDDVVQQGRVQFLDLVQLGLEDFHVAREFVLGGLPRPLVGEATVVIGGADVDVAVGGLGQGGQDLQGIGAGVLGPVLPLGGHGAYVHALDEVVGRQSGPVEAVEQSGSSSVEVTGGFGQVDGQLLIGRIGRGGRLRQGCGVCGHGKCDKDCGGRGQEEGREATWLSGGCHTYCSGVVLSRGSGTDRCQKGEGFLPGHGFRTGSKLDHV